MKTETLEKKFIEIGADVVINPSTTRSISLGYTIDVRDKQFILNIGENIKMDVIDVDRKDRHLLLNVTETIERKGGRKEESKHKFICGFDERDFFSAAIPETYSWVKNIKEAKQALKPKDVVEVEKNIPGKHKLKRKNKARIRQGEWFFIKANGLKVYEGQIHKNEPISRGRGSKPHMVDEVYREGGTSVRVCRQHPNGITEPEYRKLIQKDPTAVNWNWRNMTRDASVYARGCVRHKDHATIYLDDWHKVTMNTESLASSRANMAFLD